MSSKKRALAMAGVFLIGVIGGSALMYNDKVYEAVSDALGKGATQNAIASSSGVSGITTINVNNMDLETAMMAVQSNRAQLLDQQLKDQMNDVQQRNDRIAKLNQALQASNAVAASFSSGAKPGDAIQASDSLKTDMKTALTNAGLTIAAPATKAELDAAISKIKSMIDSESNSQQMDMLRLQSLTNKRNEAFDVMTNFIQKMQDSRSAIIGNMR